MSGDRISEAYKGNIDDFMKQSSRKRIEWICSQAIGKTILDIGCSQGITDILLGRENKIVTAIDNDYKSIEYANNDLKNEKENVINNVEFIGDDFLEYNFRDKKYDTIILAEVLEHVFNPSLFLEKIAKLLNEQGKLIVSVPFGINKHPDHKRTYYFMELYNELSDNFDVEDVYFMGKWIGMCCTLQANDSNKKKLIVDNSIITKIENAFFVLDEEKEVQRNKLTKSYEFIDKLKKKNMEQKEIYINQIELLSEEVKKKNMEQNEKIDRIESLSNELQILKDEIRKIKTDDLIHKRKLNEKEKEIKVMEKKYSELKNSKLPKLQIKYWKLIGKVRRKLNRIKYNIRELAKKSSLLRNIVYKYRRKKNNIKVTSNSLNSVVKNNQKDIKLNATQRREKFEKDTDKTFFEKIEYILKQMPESNGGRYYQKHKYKIGIIADEFLYQAFKDAADFVFINPKNWQEVIQNIDFLLVVSAWKGINEEWRGAAQENSPKRELIYTIINKCKQLDRKVVFYSKEDPPNYDNFLGIAKKCDYIFTTCVEVVEKYKQDCDNDNVGVICFGINPLYHNPIGCHSKYKKDGVIFSGSWMIKYPNRQKDMRMLFDGTIESNSNLKIIDRNYSYTQSENYRYPEEYWKYISPEINHMYLQKVHKLFDWSLNINTVTDSISMFANRAYELQAAGNLIISNYNPGVNSKLPMVFTVTDKSEVAEIIHAYDSEEKYKRQMDGVRSVMSNETTFDRVGELIKEIGFKVEKNKRKILVVCETINSNIREMFDKQTYKNKELININHFTQNKFEESDMVAFWSSECDYDIFYLEDMSNGFKYTDSDYITKDSYYDGKSLVEGNEHNYVNIMKNKLCTLFWSKSYTVDQLLTFEDNIDLPNGYSIDHFSFNLRKIKIKRNNEYKLSVIIPVYNNGNHLMGKAFSSLYRSSMFDEMEIILVDDGSNDGYTDKIVKYLEINYSNIKAYLFNDGGSGSASRPRNKGIEFATAEYVTYLDPDNEAINDGYSSLYKEIINGKFDITVGNMLKLTEKILDMKYYDNFDKKYGSEVMKNDYIKYMEKTKFSPISIQAMIIRKSIILENNIIQPIGAAGEDTLFCWQLFANAQSIKAINLPIHIYYAAVEGSTVNTIGKKFFDKYYLIEKPRRKFLEESNTLNMYMKLRYNYYFSNWILKKLLLVNKDEIEECIKIVYKMHQIYEDVYLNDNKIINDFINSCKNNDYNRTFKILSNLM